MNPFSLLKASVSAICLTAVLAQPAWAQTSSPDRCRAYADTMTDYAKRADAKACPEFKRHANNWDSHFNWCRGKAPAAVQNTEDTWGAKLDGCMSSIEATKMEKAMAAADQKAKASGSIGSYNERWSKGLKRMADQGMIKPFHREGYEFQASTQQAKRWGAGLQKGKQLGMYAVCDTCKGITVRLLDKAGNVVAKGQTQGNAIELIAYPKAASEGAFEFTVSDCQTRDDSCKLRYTTFVL